MFRLPTAGIGVDVQVAADECVEHTGNVRPIVGGTCFQHAERVAGDGLSHGGFEQVPGSRFAEIRTDVLRHRRGDLTPSSALSRHWII